MQTDVRTLRPTDPLATAARIMLASDQTAFPVVANDGVDSRVVGMLTRPALYDATKSHTLSKPVTERLSLETARA